MTGASGRYGRLATEKLIAQGRARDLILITRTPAKLADCAQAGCEVRYGDFDKPETLRAAVSGADKLLLISGTRVGARVRQHQAADRCRGGGGRPARRVHELRQRRAGKPRDRRRRSSRDGEPDPGQRPGLYVPARRPLCRCDDPQCRSRLHRLRCLADEHPGRSRGDGVARGLRRLRRRRADAGRARKQGVSRSPAPTARTLPRSRRCSPR